jgi:hypothetical protein
MTQLLFDKVVAASGLSPLFAKTSVARALARVSVIPESLTTESLRAALPELEKVLKVFLEGDEVSKRLSEIQRLAR